VSSVPLAPGQRASDARRLLSPALVGRLQGYLFLSPALVGLIVFVLGPMLYAFGLSFVRWDLIRPNPRFVGLDNYATVLTSPEFWRALWVTVAYTLGTVPPAMAIGLALAMLLDRQLPARGVFRAICFIPSITSLVAVAVVWAWIFHPDFGLLNAGLRMVGITGSRWLGSPRDALSALMVVAIWRHVGYDMVIFLAGLQTIPRDLLEAATVDGAGRWQRFRSVIWPLLAPTTLFVLVISVIDSFQSFTTIDALTQGGPAGATTVLLYHLYEVAFVKFEMGRASAIAYVTFALIMALTALQLRIGRDRVDAA
jgi:ABC-type sugar transport system permease subunit